jgi:hypothetical protein
LTTSFDGGGDRHYDLTACTTLREASTSTNAMSTSVGFGATR